MIRLLIVDDHRSVAEGLAALLGSHDDLEIVDIAGSADEAQTLACSADLDVVLMDIALPEVDGFTAAEQLLAMCSLHVVMFSSYSNPEYVLKAIAIGASGYLLKDESGATIAEFVRAVAAGELAFSRGVWRVAKCLGCVLPGPALPEELMLTQREREVVLALTRGDTMSACAKRFGVQRGTVRTHWHRARTKMGLRPLPQRLLTSGEPEGLP